MIDRDQALQMLREHIAEEGLLAHSLQTEAVCSALADRLGHDPILWGRTGLLHDLDYSETREDAKRHGLISAEMLQGLLPEEGLQAIRAHNGERNGTHPASVLDFGLRCGESVTGLVTANALVRPEGFVGMKPKSLKKKMKEKSFAASVNRENILECERIGIELGEFFSLAIEALAPLATPAQRS
jgi:uncharacterized protein